MGTKCDQDLQPLPVSLWVRLAICVCPQTLWLSPGGWEKSRVPRSRMVTFPQSSRWCLRDGITVSLYMLCTIL